MATSTANTYPWWGRLTPKGLTARLAMAVCAALLLTEALFLLPSAQMWQRGNRDDLVDQVRFAWYHASNPASFLTSDDKRRIGQRMVNDGLILGGTVYDAAGERLTAFGQRPELELSLARLSGVRLQESTDGSAFDVHLSPDETGLAHDLVIRIPSGPVVAATRDQVQRFGLSLLLIAGLTAFLFVFATHAILIRPLRRINDALGDVARHPERAAARRLTMVRRDELGEMATSADMLFASLSSVYHDELGSMKGALDAFGFALLQFDAEDRLAMANGPALRLFAVDDVAGFANTERNCASIIGARRSEPRPMTDLFEAGKTPLLIGLHVPSGVVTALVYPAKLDTGEAAPGTRFLAIVPVDDLMRDARKALVEAKRTDTRYRAQAAELQEMRRLLESCLCLLEAPSVDAATAGEPLLPDRILNTWYNDAARDGLVSGKLEHGLLPRIVGHPEMLRNVLRQAMLLVYAQTEAERPFLKVDAKPRDGGTLQFVIQDVSSKRVGGGGKRRKSVDPTLPRAALMQALARVGGSFVSLERKDEGAELVFTVRAAKADAAWAGLSEDEPPLRQSA